MGAIEILLQISQIGIILVGTVSLLLLLALRALSDPLDQVRDAANCAFRHLIIIMPLEDVKFSHLLNFFDLESSAK
jgi:hypothetical protein